MVVMEEEAATSEMQAVADFVACAGMRRGAKVQAARQLMADLK